MISSKFPFRNKGFCNEVVKYNSMRYKHNSAFIQQINTLNAILAGL